MKKFIVILLILTLLLSAVGCRSLMKDLSNTLESTLAQVTITDFTDKIADESDNITSDDTEPANEDNSETEEENPVVTKKPDSVKPDETKAPTTTAPETTAPETEAPVPSETETVTVSPETEPEIEVDENFELGVMRNDIYENHYIGIGCEIPSNWRFYTDAEIRQANGLAANIIGEEYKQALIKKDVYTDMFATTLDGLCNMNITMEKASKTAIDNLNVETFLAQIAPVQLQELRKVGYTNISYIFTNFTIGSEQFYGTLFTMQYGGRTAYSSSVVFKCESYLAALSTFCFDENVTDDIHDFYYFLNT